jgi:CRP/FNR family cyclic AMP-dependent transcriptional regulator
MSDPATLTTALRAVELFDDLPESHLDKLAALASLEERRAGETLFQEGGRNDRFFLVLGGAVALDMTIPRRGPVRVLTVGPGEILAWSALLGAGVMTTSAVVTEDARLLALPGPALRALCRSDHEVGFAVMERVARALSRRLLATRLQLLDLYSETQPVPRPLG